jgi:hypothetical protein
MLKSIRFLVLLLLTMPTESVAANLPQCEKDLPIFHAAIQDMRLEAELRASEPDRPTAQGWEPAPGEKRSSAHLAFTTGMPAEEVLKFYLQMFGVPLRVDKPLPPLDLLAFHDPDNFFDCYDDRGKRISAGEKSRSEMERKRRPLSPGKWLEAAAISWVVPEANGDLSELTLQIRDASFVCRQENSNGRRTETQIRFSRITWQSP